MLVVLLLGVSGIGGTVNAVNSALSSGSQAGKVVVSGMAGSGSVSGSMLPESITSGVPATIKRQAGKI